MAARRLHVVHLQPGEISLSAPEAHHARDVLRLSTGDEVELFDDAGATARGRIHRCDAREVVVAIDHIEARIQNGFTITIASAVPKGDRADWMIEKLSELDVDRFIPLQTDRSVVTPTGKNKRDRWLRLATESAKQSRRIGVMQIDELTPLTEILTPSPGTPGEGWGEGASVFLATELPANPLPELLKSAIGNRQSAITLLIGPEGGWSPRELELFKTHNLTPARLTTTILRVETAAVAAAAIVAVHRAAMAGPPSTPS